MNRVINRGCPNRELALASYRKLARRYDRSCYLIEPVRCKTIRHLSLVPGETVIDVASGTGLSLPMLSVAVGAAGKVIAIELSPEMAHIARARIERRLLRNVTQIVGAVEEAQIPIRADALLFHYTHDVLRSPEALLNIFRSAKPEARVAIAGFKLPSDWRRLFNAWHRWRAGEYLSTYDGIYTPWDYLLGYVSDFRIQEENFLGSGYIATARLAAIRRSADRVSTSGDNFSQSQGDHDETAI